MVVGENSRAGDMMVNVTREKQKTNIRTHAADDAIKLTPPIVHTLETAIEFIADDELVEVTPDAHPHPQAGASRSRTAAGSPADDLGGVSPRAIWGNTHENQSSDREERSTVSFLVIVANRLPVQAPTRGRGPWTRSPGGLAEALHRTLAARGGCGSGGPAVGTSAGSPPISATSCVPVQLDSR